MTDATPRTEKDSGPGLPTGGPRMLLRQIRTLMSADRGARQERLDRIVVLVAANMVAEVCSIYLLYRGDLELFATEGLNRAAVHRTRLHVGEGLVGEIARTAEPMNLSDAPHHPKFAYRPETGEDPFQSFLGVPILRGGRVVGVLTVQNRTQRHYGEDELEALLTIAMVLAEIVQAIELETARGAKATPSPVAGPLSLSAQILAEGVAVGHAVLHEPRVKVTKLIAEDTEVEMMRLDRAIEELQHSVDHMLTHSETTLAGESREVLETYRMFAHDSGWLKRLKEALMNGITAEAAVEREQSEVRAKMMRQKHPYLRERLHDLDDLANRLLRLLAGKRPTVQADELPDDAIILARTMGPAELLDYDRTALRGLILEEGSASSHVAIVARALGLPILSRVEGLLEKVEAGDLVIVDGESGELHVRPTPELVRAYRNKIVLRTQREAAFSAIRDEPAITKDGKRIHLNMNAGLLVDLPHLAQSGAEGIGLFRTELQFMVGSTMPRLAAQRALYKAVLDAAGGRPVVFRTVDLGGDKIVPYMTPEREENPALGWRAIRIALDRPVLLRYQARAMLEAAAGRELRLMFPLVSTVDEFVRARAFVEEEVTRAKAKGLTLPSAIKIGTMIEVPALVYQLTELLPLIDFASIGSNDLLQFFFAVDRQHPRMSDRYDMLSPPFLRLLKEIVGACERARVAVSVCGEMAGRPLEAMALLGVGLTTISMPPTAIGPVKLMARGLSLAALTACMDALLRTGETDIRGRLGAFALAQGVRF
jgi:phosphotransferase system enzyme I (PtsP)